MTARGAVLDMVKCKEKHQLLVNLEPIVYVSVIKTMKIRTPARGPETCEKQHGCLIPTDRQSSRIGAIETLFICDFGFHTKLDDNSATRRNYTQQLGTCIYKQLL